MTGFLKGLLSGFHRHVTSYNLAPKLFFSHFAVALAATLAFVTVSLLAPALSSPFLGNVLAGGAATVIAAGASLFVARRIVVPVRRVLVATRMISAGRYEERVPPVENDELGELSEGFNSMAKALEEGERRRSRFVADVSHELKTPLSTLEGYLEGMTNGVIEPTEEKLGLLYGESGRMNRLVDDLRQLSHAEAGRLTLDLAPVSPGATVGRAVEGMKPLFEAKGVGLAAEVAGVPRVTADTDRVVQVLANLLQNALRHTPEGGRVTVAASSRIGEVLFRVGDTGVGVAPDQLERLFERFYRAEGPRSGGEARGGSGLGLAISRALVDAMGGRIWAESAGEGRGATFFFTLPTAATGRIRRPDEKLTID